MYCDLFSNLTCKAANNFNRYMFCFGFYNSAGVAPLFDADAEYNDMPQEVKNIFFGNHVYVVKLAKAEKIFRRRVYLYIDNVLRLLGLKEQTGYQKCIKMYLPMKHVP